MLKLFIIANLIIQLIQLPLDQSSDLLVQFIFQLQIPNLGFELFFVPKPSDQPDHIRGFEPVITVVAALRIHNSSMSFQCHFLRIN